MDGQIQQLPCTAKFEVKTQSGNYQSFTNITTIYRPVNAKNLTLRCQCSGGSGIPHVIFPLELPMHACTKQSTGICIVNKTDWQQINIPVVEKIHEGNYICHSRTSGSFAAVKLYVFG